MGLEKLFSVFRKKERLPDAYRKQFEQETICILKARIQLFLILVISFFIFALVTSYPYTPDILNPWEIPFDVTVFVFAILIFILSRITGCLPWIKVYAYFMNALLIFTCGALYLIYPDAFYIGSLGFMMLLFFIAMAMPWNKREIFLIGAGSTAVFILTGFLSRTPTFQIAYYLDTNLYVMGFSIVICMVFKHHDEKQRLGEFRMRKELEEKKAAIERDLEIAKQVHRSLIPKSFSNDQVDIAVSYLPVFYVGGDYAKFHFISPDELLIFIMDITGHGVPAALLVNRIHSEVSALAQKIKHPGEFLERVDSFIQETFAGTSMFLSAYACLVDFRKKRLFYSNFGHPPQVLYHRRNHEIRYMASQRHWLGVKAPGGGSVYEAEIDFEKGDRVLLFTDGLIEVKGPSGEFFGKKGLEDFLGARGEEPAEVFNQKLLETLNRFKGDSSFLDDIFILNIQIKRT